ncbi:MAG: hypothetical protein AB7O65_06085 [Candidatus Korobacteraceae bacterium]
MTIRNTVLLMLAGAAMATAQMSPPPSQSAQAVRRASAEVVVVPTAPAPPVPTTERSVTRRDPFVSPIVRATPSSGSTCKGGGKKCLTPDHVVLRGIVVMAGGERIAVVESTGRKISYFLRENDPVFNGYVVRITEDSVVFRENTQDNLGRAGTRDITRRITPA